MRIRFIPIDKKIVFTTFFVLFIFNICQSQTVIKLDEQDLNETPIDSIIFDEIRLSEVLSKSGADLFIVKKLAKKQTDTTTIIELNEQRKELIDAYVFFTKDKFSRDLSNLSTRDLENLDRQWSFQKDKIESIIADYHTIIDRLEGEKETVVKITKFWEKYKEYNKNILNNAVLVEDLNNIKDQINVLRPAVETKVNLLAGHINSLNRIITQIDERLARISDQLSSTNNLFKQDASPYWKSFSADSFSQSSDSVLRTLKASFFDLKQSAKNFVSTHILILFLFLFIYVMNLRIKKRLRTQTDFIETHSLKINSAFDTPIRTAIFFTFVFAYFIYLRLVPAVFLDIISIIAIGVLFLISRNIFDKEIVDFIKHYIIFWFAIKLVEILTAQSLISRTLLILASFYFLFWLFKYHKNKELQKHIKNTKLARTLLSYYLKLALVLTFFSILCVAFGYTNLSLSASSIIVKLSLLVVFLYLWNPLLKRFLLLIMDEKYFKSKRFIYNNKDAVLKATFKIINVLTYIVFLYSFLTIISIFNPFINWLNELVFNEISIGSLTFSLWDIVLFVLIIILSGFLSKVIQLILQDEVLPKADLGRGFPETISMLVKYLIIAVGYFIAITTLGFEMSQLTIIFGALSVGIGFGLQNIFNNLVSGLILIFARPIRIDDTIEVNNMVGKVNSIGVRSSNVRTFDGAEVIIPNGNLISNEVINWTLSDQKRRINVMVGVAYGSDVRKVSDLLKTILQENDQVMKFPDPMILFDEFADSSLNFKLLFWTADIGDWMKVKSDILFEINDAFTKENIEIPFPQRDIHMRS